MSNVTNESPEHIKWQILSHLAYIGSAILLAWTDKIMQKEESISGRARGAGLPCRPS